MGLAPAPGPGLGAGGHLVPYPPTLFQTEFQVTIEEAAEESLDSYEYADYDYSDYYYYQQVNLEQYNIKAFFIRMRRTLKMCSTHYTATCTTCQATPTSAAPRICTSGWSPPGLGSASQVSLRPTTRVSSTSPASTLKGNALPAGCLSEHGAGFQEPLKKVSFSQSIKFLNPSFFILVPGAHHRSFPSLDFPLLLFLVHREADSACGRWPLL